MMLVSEHLRERPTINWQARVQIWSKPVGFFLEISLTAAYVRG